VTAISGTSLLRFPVEAIFLGLTEFHGVVDARIMPQGGYEKDPIITVGYMETCSRRIILGEFFAWWGFLEKETFSRNKPARYAFQVRRLPDAG
jgi:hypothetical protein